ncbi:MAG: phosphatase PAP2 family protein [Chitinophagaceae bacterium]|nr:phosphatase PAP2 family protein [Chitinophagaceae bacterium]
MVKHIKKLYASIALLSVELLIVLAMFLLSVITFAFIINYIFGSKGTYFDTQAFDFVKPFISQANTRIIRLITFFGSGEFLVPANIGVAIYFLFLKEHRWYSLRVPVVSLGSFLVMSSLKLFFGRVRPENPVFEAALGFSFPSGHAMSAMTFYGLLIFLVWKYLKNVAVKWILTIALILFIFLIGFSRIYLRVHFASDVLAGFSAGIIWLVLSLWIMHTIEKYTRKKIEREVEVS